MTTLFIVIAITYSTIFVSLEVKSITEVKTQTYQEIDTTNVEN